MLAALMAYHKDRHRQRLEGYGHPARMPGHPGAGRDRKDCPLTPESIQRDGDAAHTLTLDFWLQDCEKTFPLFKPTPFVAL